MNPSSHLSSWECGTFSCWAPSAQSAACRGPTFVLGQTRVLSMNYPLLILGWLRLIWGEDGASFLERQPLSPTRKSLLTFNIVCLRTWTLKWHDSSMTVVKPLSLHKTSSLTWYMGLLCLLRKIIMRIQWRLRTPLQFSHRKFWRKAFHPGISSGT